MLRQRSRHGQVRMAQGKPGEKDVSTVPRRRNLLLFLCFVACMAAIFIKVQRLLSTSVGIGSMLNDSQSEKKEEKVRQAQFKLRSRTPAAPYEIESGGLQPAAIVDGVYKESMGKLDIESRKPANGTIEIQPQSNATRPSKEQSLVKTVLQQTYPAINQLEGNETSHPGPLVGQDFQRRGGKFSVNIRKDMNATVVKEDQGNVRHQHHQQTPNRKAGTDVFYNLFIPFNKTSEELLSAYSVIREQIGQIESSVQSPVSVNVVNIGNPVNEGMVRDICSQYEHVTCILKRYYETGFEDLTLTELYDHCQANEQDTVIYMHNKGSFHSQLQGGWSYIRQDVWRRMGTMAAANNMCLGPLRDNACDFCGLIVTPMPWLHVPGNFWSARCSYVRKLLHPQSYQQAMNRYRQEFAEPYINNGTISMRFQIKGKRCFGDERWASENWIGSSPSVLPCDLANVSDIKHWQTVDRNSSEFSFSLAPRQNLYYMMDKSLPRIPPFILNRPALRFRDYHLLGGMITRWQRLYNTTPANSSWVWDYYPDAQVWQGGLEKHGDRAFEMVTSRV